ncbi:hypothetical protein Vretimale_14143 [Volvox reticuliferus]|uniref:Protein-serine/threonine kinase n=1 Tax=Volvox reticuliferus TaxID=1737510 RepID=A0A8J4CV45_9CHLO|nr:hypothetical protein Vretifemale_16201 [Volvox reticuliferus]GIM10411.1 hypothetical protein Vretimale_14143 [Volvox reticuliferus]
MATFTLPSAGLIDASCTLKVGGVALSAVRTACSRSTCPMEYGANTFSICFGFHGGGSKRHERGEGDDVAGYTLVTPQPSTSGAPVQQICPSPAQQLHRNQHDRFEHITGKNYQSPHGLAAAATALATTAACPYRHNDRQYVGERHRNYPTTSSMDYRRSVSMFNQDFGVGYPGTHASCRTAAEGTHQRQVLRNSLSSSVQVHSSLPHPATSGPFALFGRGLYSASPPQMQPLSFRLYQVMSASQRADIQAAALKKQTGVSLKHLLDFGTQPLERQMLLSARFLHSEIPIRLAHRLMDLNHLPPGLSEEPHVRRVKGWYAASFADFRSFPPIKDNMDVVRFTAMLKNAFRRHNNVVPAIAKGVEEYKRDLERKGESSQERESEIQHFLDTFFLSRIAIRFLAGHHISMFEPPRPDHIGLVHTRCSPYQIAFDAVSEARAICFREYGGAPQVTVLGNTGLTMAYVPSHLHHMVFELVKNSLRAVQERYSESDLESPPIQVVVAEGLEDVTIKVSDQGGGIPRSGLQRIWTYLYTTARSPLPDVDIDSTNMPAVLAGYGCGLPLSRLYARYFGGDLQMISMEGYGTDAYLHLARLGNDEEPLPGSV